MVGVMFWMNWALGCIVAVAFPVFFFVVNRLTDANQGNCPSTAVRGRSVASTTPNHRPSASCRRCPCRPSSWTIFSIATQRACKQESGYSSLSAGLERSVDLLATSTAAVVLVLRSQCARGPTHAGDLIVFANYLRIGFKPIRQLGKIPGANCAGPSHPNRILELLATPLEIQGWVIRYLRLRLLDTSVLRTCLFDTKNSEWHSGMSVSR